MKKTLSVLLSIVTSAAFVGQGAAASIGHTAPGAKAKRVATESATTHRGAAGKRATASAKVNAAGKETATEGRRAARKKAATDQPAAAPKTEGNGTAYPPDPVPPIPMGKKS